MPVTQRKCIYGGLTLDVDRHYIGSVTATTHQEKGIITLESHLWWVTAKQNMINNFHARVETGKTEEHTYMVEGPKFDGVVISTGRFIWP